MSGFIYNHRFILNLMRTHTSNTDHLRPAITRFATAFLTLQSIHKKKDALRKVFTCDEWNKSKCPRDVKGKKSMVTVLSTTFWNNIVYAMKITAPLVRVLRLVDGEKKPPMGYIYEAMDGAKETIKEAMGGNDMSGELVERFNTRDSLNPITLQDIDECNEWLIGSMQKLVHEDDDLTWDQVTEASGENKQRTRHTSPALTCKWEVQVEAREELLKKNHYLRQMRQMTKNYTLMRIIMTRMGVTMT
ncbi:hypothetical protein HHK36_015010 [Tetracentron sinense]|uniref:Uncharacterized protein n=1 Tax=Tetracentron sinense TaxID=13715 RepID=A0A834Z3Y1_TETSI|nr:hypothetical protein HHK36_015010 [Tetracentron sinense]